MARESMSECPSPTIPGSGHISFTEDDVIEDEEVEQASRNIASIDSKLAIFEVFKFKILYLTFIYFIILYLYCLQNKTIPLIDLQKSSNTVALVESFLGEFKHDDEGTSEPVTPEKISVKEVLLVENIKEPIINNPQISKETLIDDPQISLKCEDKVLYDVKINQTDTDVCEPINETHNIKKETEECVATPIVEQPLPPPPPPPVKRKVKSL